MSFTFADVCLAIIALVVVLEFFGVHA